MHGGTKSAICTTSIPALFCSENQTKKITEKKKKGCVSSNLLHHDDEFTQLGSSALSHHIVSLKSSTYGLLTLDPPPPPNHPTTPPTPPSRFTLGSIFPTPLSEPKSLWSEPRPPRTDPEVINSWELMAGLDADSFRFSPIPPPKPFAVRDPIAAAGADKENSNPNRNLKPLNDDVLRPPSKRNLLLLDRFENICPSSGRKLLYNLYGVGFRDLLDYYLISGSLLFSN
ncbi:hypothetical protein FEM48_Zijuj04G0179900 [Ziziphus jujuba var. spinosa]|uniref:Uncharacterized protein n=1 Tax=Ziziphus jujuba var. spinosa TaxID=714518 RepID=A0A978VLC4_ZIZJJ|nr:hypothetical protein FEM48_Zijuj04G0179900 [Ziziphus jujuba var. spinosa]